MLMEKLIVMVFIGLFFNSWVINAQEEVNYDESKVPRYTLPVMLKTESGKYVESPDEWYNIRRPEILQLFKTHVYGDVPNKQIQVKHKVISINHQSINQLSTCKQIRFDFIGTGNTVHMYLLVYLPNDAAKPVPAFLGLNFYGNHTIYKDSEILLPEGWVRNNEDFGITANKATEASRGVRYHRWPVEMILKRGYALATIYYGDLDPDYDDGFQNGIHPLFYREGQTAPAPDEWGSIGAWAWGLSRAMDYFEQDPDIDEQKVIVIGHSRLGKTALWAGAQDQRFAIVISNNSGCGGAALSVRRFGETVEKINNSFPHWFCDNFTRYNNNEDTLPVDQHMLIALIAPRPVYVASAAEDLWADPKGEFLSCKYADLIYKFVGEDGMEVFDMPDTDQPLKKGTVGYHIRSGKHDITRYDWEQYLDFADLHLKD